MQSGNKDVYNARIEQDWSQLPEATPVYKSRDCRLSNGVTEPYAKNIRNCPWHRSSSFHHLNLYFWILFGKTKGHPCTSRENFLKGKETHPRQ